jgi:CBS domain containing-hemolysin-like protein
VISLRRDMSLRQMLGMARRAGFNRFPVLDEDGDRPVGLFHLKDLLQMGPLPERPLAASLRELLYVPESKDVAALLDEMATGGSHLAAVVDEHGDFTGIVTMADCLQALLGSVGDTPRHDTEMTPLGDGGWVVGGRADLRELQEVCGIVLPPSRDYVTIAGFLMARLGRIPEVGDLHAEAGVELEVVEMTDHRVDRVQITPLEEDSSAEPEGGR